MGTSLIYYIRIEIIPDVFGNERLSVLLQYLFNTARFGSLMIY